MFRLDYRIAVALSEAANVREGIYSESDGGVSILLQDEEGRALKHVLPANTIPKDTDARVKCIIEELRYMQYVFEERINTLRSIGKWLVVVTRRGGCSYFEWGGEYGESSL